ncbi:MAG TPA: L,D-transpeptidase family protein [Candidatus Polarisedimenticolaceae bacterium]|nr:L,D-transpeptidase family protein [Candidatus Polarisedimenticolaceae bacterium]
MLVATMPGNAKTAKAKAGDALVSDKLEGWYRLAFIVFSGLVFVAFVLQLGLSSLMAGRVLPGVTVAGMEIGGMTRADARELLAQPLVRHTINIAVGSNTFKVSSSDIGARYDTEATLNQAMLTGREQAFVPLQLLSAHRTQPLGYAYQLNRKSEEAFIEKVVASSGQAPLDAAIVVKNGEPAVQADVDGRSLSRQVVSQAIATQLDNFSSTPVRLEPTVQHARIKATDAERAILQTKQLLAVPVTITYLDRVFSPTPAQKDSWITFQKSPNNEAPGLIPSLSKDGIKNYLQAVAVQINANPINRKINVQNGNSQETQVGQDGIQLDQDTLATMIAGSVGAKQPVVTAAPTKLVPYQTEYNRSVSLDYGKYIEVNLGQQHLWVYQDHKVIYESAITSGAAGAGFPTATGLFSIQAKQTNRNLNGYAIGYNYNVFVKYWMPFYGNYGLHDASWRGGFGGQDYYYGGSHGCVNLPEATAAFIFGWADVGTPVWIHH